MANTDMTTKTADDADNPVQASADGETPLSAFLAVNEVTGAEETYRPSDAEIAQQKKRNMAIVWGILGFIGLIYAITILRLAAAAGGAS